MRVPVFTDSTSDEKRIAELQLGYAARMRKSAYYVVEKTKTSGELQSKGGLCDQANYLLLH